MDNSSFVIEQPVYYHDSQSKSLEQRLDSISISESAEKELRDRRAKKILKDKVLGSFKSLELIDTLLNWNNGVNEEIKEAKKSYLLQEYFNKVDQQEDSINKFKNFISKPHGYTLFNKVLQILDNNPPDTELIDVLVKSLKHIIISGNFEDLFEKHKYALAQIESLPTQAILILADYKKYPEFTSGAAMYNRGKVEGEWAAQFSKTYARSKGIIDQGIILRMQHSIKQLITQGYIIAYSSGEDNGIDRCILTDVSLDILPYIV